MRNKNLTRKFLNCRKKAETQEERTEDQANKQKKTDISEIANVRNQDRITTTKPNLAIALYLPDVQLRYR